MLWLMQKSLGSYPEEGRQRMLKRRILFVIIIFIIFSSSTCSNLDRSVDFPAFDGSLFYDMFLRHEGLPAGVPDDYDWKKRPILGAGAKVPTGWNVITSWGQVYAEETFPNPDIAFPLVRVHIKDLQLFILRNNGTWELYQDVQSPIGYLYVESFDDDEHHPTEIRDEPGGGISVKAGSGFNFHFYPEKWEGIYGNNVKAVFVVCKARLIGTENYENPEPKYLVNVGADYWRYMGCALTPENNWVVGIGRFKYVTTEWQFFIMHTFSREEVDSIMLPVED